MRIRLTGTREEIATVLAPLTGVLEVREVSTFCPNRGTSTLGRVYVEIGPRPIEPGRPDQITEGGV